MGAPTCLAWSPQLSSLQHSRHPEASASGALLAVGTRAGELCLWFCWDPPAWAPDGSQEPRVQLVRSCTVGPGYQGKCAAVSVSQVLFTSAALAAMGSLLLLYMDSRCCACLQPCSCTCRL